MVRTMQMSWKSYKAHSELVRENRMHKNYSNTRERQHQTEKTRSIVKKKKKNYDDFRFKHLSHSFFHFSPKTINKHCQTHVWRYRKDLPEMEYVQILPTYRRSYFWRVNATKENAQAAKQGTNETSANTIDHHDRVL